MMYTAQSESFQSGKHAFTIRYPRGNGVMPDWRTPFEEMKIGKGRKIKDGGDLAILSFGPLGNFALQACGELDNQGINAGLFDMRFAKPLDEALLHEIFSAYDRVITLEDGCLQGGFGSAVLEFMIDNGYTSQVNRLGIPDSIVEHGEPSELYHECGLDAAGIYAAALEMIQQSSRRVSAIL